VEALTTEATSVEVRAGVARITLDRPDALNPLSVAMAREVHSAIAATAADPETRAVLITGAGRGFSSGADLSSTDTPTTPEGRPDVLTGLREAYNPLILAIRELPKPVVAAVNGPAAGIGASLALACDLVVASESSYLLLAFANVGLTIDGGASTLIAAKAGHARASEMGLLADRVPAAQALEWGLVNRVVPDGELIAATEEILARLVAGPPGSYAATKRLLNEAAYADLAAQLDREAVAQQECADSQDFVEGVVAFMQKRPPEFTGK
jgi:2-(1,2-epoxy-1,2-dihydrophenyl)acetyl-CoA isomerase